MNKRSLIISLLLLVIAGLMLLEIGRRFMTIDNFHCVTTSQAGVCYWYHGK